MTDPPTQAIVFDLDDTLYPERAYVISGFAAVAAKFSNLLGDPTETVRRMTALFDSPDRSRVYNRLVAERDVANPDVLVGEMIETYRTHAPSISLYDDVDQTLQRLRASHRLGLITDGRSHGQHAKIDALGLRDRFDHVIVTDDLGREFRKPHPRAFEEMSVALAVAAKNCTYVGDNAAKDFLAPNRLGWRSIQIVRPDALYAGATPAPGGEPGRTISSLTDVV